MSWKYSRSLILIFLVCILGIGTSPPPGARGEVNIYTSPIQAGCYLVQHDQCKIHVDPFTINFATGKKLVFFQFIATRVISGSQQVIYDFRPDQSNPVPRTGDTYAPSMVAKDLAATCGQTYTISLWGQDTGDTVPSELGSTQQITCPTGTFLINLPLVKK
jgi:hypothetical protein